MTATNFRKNTKSEYHVMFLTKHCSYAERCHDDKFTLLHVVYIKFKSICDIQ